MADTQKFVAGWNLPGCLPEMEPAVFDSEEEAQQFISDEQQFVFVPDDPYVYWVEPLLEDA
jgi:hypothetical protein